MKPAGPAPFALDPRLETAGKLVFQARHGDTVEETTIPLRPGAGNPLLHLDLDRPICASIVRRHGGSIRATIPEEGGLSCSVVLPSEEDAKQVA